MSELIELALRCEQAAGRDADLQYAIMTRVMGYRDVHGDRRLFDRGNDGYWTMFDYDGPKPPLPDPTTSLDAAMTLIPEGFGFDVSTNYSEPYAVIWTDDDAQCCPSAHAATPALALCAAALRARASLASDPTP